MDITLVDWYFFVTQMNRGKEGRINFIFFEKYFFFLEQPKTENRFDGNGK